MNQQSAQLPILANRPDPAPAQSAQGSQIAQAMGPGATTTVTIYQGPAYASTVTDEVDEVLDEPCLGDLFNQLRALIYSADLKSRGHLVLVGSRRFLDQVSDRDANWICYAVPATAHTRPPPVVVHVNVASNTGSGAIPQCGRTVAAGDAASPSTRMFKTALSSPATTIS